MRRLCFICSLLPQVVFAGGGEVVFDVRAIEVSNPISSVGREAGANPQIESRLLDIREKLVQLSFHTFKLLARESQTVPLLHKATISLVGGNQLFVRPLYTSSDRVGVWLKWHDGHGMEVLDSRMHLSVGENVLTGTEIGEGGKALVLAIAVHPREESESKALSANVIPSETPVAVELK